MQVTFETKAWISEYNSKTPEELRTPEGATTLHYADCDLSGHGYTFAGIANVTLALLDAHALVDNKVASLREQAANIRAEATAKVTRIEGQIQQLLCIENNSSPSALDEYLNS